MSITASGMTVDTSTSSAGLLRCSPALAFMPTTATELAIKSGKHARLT
jgi:hypothetical protein